MNAQLRERLEAANKELIGAAKHHQSITDAIAALAAPKEAGDAEANIEYLQRVRKEDGAEAALDDAIDMLRRLAAPSKEAGDADWVLVPREPTKEMAERAVDAAVWLARGRPWFPFAWHAALAAAPQADQQGASPKWTEGNPKSLEGASVDWPTIVEGLRLADQFFDGDDRHWEWDDGETFPASKVRAAYKAALACKNQQGASLEGEAVVWVQLEDGKPVAMSFTRNEAAGCTTPFTASKASPEWEPPRGWGIAGNYGDGKWRCFREGKPQTYLGNPQATRADAMAECHRLAALSKASPDDQRQEGAALKRIAERTASDERQEVRALGRPSDAAIAAALWWDHDTGDADYQEATYASLLAHAQRIDAASPPTEAAAAVGGLLALALEIESRSFRDIIDDDLVRWSRQIKDAALSPTASAAREGSK